MIAPFLESLTNASMNVATAYSITLGSAQTKYTSFTPKWSDSQGFGLCGQMNLEEQMIHSTLLKGRSLIWHLILFLQVQVSCPWNHLPYEMIRTFYTTIKLDWHCTCTQWGPNHCSTSLIDLWCVIWVPAPEWHYWDIPPYVVVISTNREVMGIF